MVSINLRYPFWLALRSTVTHIFLFNSPSHYMHPCAPKFSIIKFFVQKETAASPDLGMSILCRKVAWEKLKSSQIPAREVTWVKAFLKFAQDNNIQCALTHTQACLHKCERARDILGLLLRYIQFWWERRICG